MRNNDELIIGAAWYPEQWTRPIWEEDMKKIRDIGFNTARLGEFAWAKLEPKEGQYEFDWLKDALDILHENEIGAILCTPTATPPLWLLQKYPDIGFVDCDGYRHKHGGRQHASYNNEDFRKYSQRITEALARTFGKHPALVAWQIDNEMGSHQERCMSDDSVSRWHEWLEKRYGTIENLNEAWKTVVWSQIYSEFSEVPPPYRLIYYTHNFSLKINYRRFMADMISEFQKEQVDLIKKYSDAPVTHNSTSSQDDWRLSRHLDFPSTDVYTFDSDRTAIQYRFDMMRNLNPDGGFMTMETGSAGRIDGGIFRAGWISCFSFMNYSMGGKGLCFWPWRQQPGGAEILHEAIIHACGEPTTGWKNAKEATATRTLLDSNVKGYRPARAQVAFICSDYNGRYYFTDGSGGLEDDFDYKKRVQECYQTLVDLNVWRDVIFDEVEFESYPFIYSPYIPYFKPELLDRVYAMVEAGSTWVLGPYTGFLTEDNTIPEQAIFGELEKRLDFRTKHLIEARQLDVEIGGRAGTVSQMSAVLEPSEGDEVLGTYTSPQLLGEAWGIRKRLGKGAIYVLGSHIDENSRHHFWKNLLNREGISTGNSGEGLFEIPLVNEAEGERAIGICNWTYDEKQIHVEGESLLAASQHTQLKQQSLTLPSQSWAVISHSKDNERNETSDAIPSEVLVGESS